jgi:hypothetical protein
MKRPFEEGGHTHDAVASFRLSALGFAKLATDCEGNVYFCVQMYSFFCLPKGKLDRKIRVEKQPSCLWA